jgi:hypothetical protein
VQLPCGDGRRRDIPADHGSDGPDVPQAIHPLEDRRVAEPVVRPVVRGEPHEGEPESLVVPTRVTPETSRTDRDVGVFPERPLLRGGAWRPDRLRARD